MIHEQNQSLSGNGGRRTMADYISLVVSPVGPPPGADAARPYPLESWETDRVAAARELVPCFWLCLFSTDDVVWVRREKSLDPILWASVSQIRERYMGRDALIRQVFDGNVEAWEKWGRVLDRLPADRWLAIDAAELHQAESLPLSERLETALSWFESDAAEGFDQLLDISQLIWNPDDRVLFADREDELEYRLIGQLWPRFEPK
jgi:hypothetical protein